MSMRVVSKTHAFRGDDYVWVPSSEEFKTLERSQSLLSEHLTNVERIVTSQGEKNRNITSKISNVIAGIDSLKADIESELTNGVWKTILIETTKELCSDIDNKVHEINKVMASQMSEFVKHEIMGRSLIENLTSMKEVTVKEIVTSHNTAKTEIASTVEQALKKLDNQASLMFKKNEKLAEITGEYDKLREMLREMNLKIVEIREEMADSCNGVGVMSEGQIQRFNELFKKIGYSKGNLEQLKKIECKTRFLMILAILALLASFFCLFFK